MLRTPSGTGSVIFSKMSINTTNSYQLPTYYNQSFSHSILLSRYASQQFKTVFIIYSRVTSESFLHNQSQICLDTTCVTSGSGSSSLSKFHQLQRTATRLPHTVPLVISVSSVTSRVQSPCTRVYHFTKHSHHVPKYRNSLLIPDSGHFISSPHYTVFLHLGSQIASGPSSINHSFSECLTYISPVIPLVMPHIGHQFMLHRSTSLTLLW